MEKIILIGAGGNCKVVVDILKDNYTIIGAIDIDSTKHRKLFYGVEVLGDDTLLKGLYHQGIQKGLVTLGSVGDSSIRRKLFLLMKKMGFEMINAVSPTAILSQSAAMGEGNIIMDQTIVHADVKIGNNNIVNTGAIIEHDCVIGDHIHIAPGVKIAGGVILEDGTHIGIGASIIQGIHIGSQCIIGAGAAVIHDIPDKSVAVGVPARIIRQL